MIHVLALDAAGTPHRWLTVEEAAHYYAKGMVAWDMGDNEFVLHGGVSSLTGRQSELAVASIVALKGGAFNSKLYNRPVPFSRPMLFARDRHICAYCGEKFKGIDLEVEHVIPRSRGGANAWTNYVSACRCCNARKDNRTPEEAHMPLLYVPYAPNRHEAFILRNRHILADQMDFLLQGVPGHSRLLQG